MINRRIELNLIEIAKKYNREVADIESILKKKGVLVFSQNFPLSPETERIIDTALVQSVEMPPIKDEAISTVDPQAELMLTELFGKKETEVLENCIKKKYHIVIDTCSILRKPHAFKHFYRRCRPLLIKYNQKLLIPYSVVAELGNMIVNKTVDNSTLERAKYGYNTITSEGKQGLIEVLGSRENVWKKKNGQNGYFADSDFTVQILSWRNNGENVLLITQDYKMTLSVMKLKDIPCVESDSEIIVRKLNHLGFLIDAMKSKEAQTSQ